MGNGVVQREGTLQLEKRGRQVRVAGRFVFFFNVTATAEIYTLSLHDALPILLARRGIVLDVCPTSNVRTGVVPSLAEQDRKSTRLNSSHPSISYAVFCLK